MGNASPPLTIASDRLDWAVDAPRLAAPPDKASELFPDAAAPGEIVLCPVRNDSNSVARLLESWRRGLIPMVVKPPLSEPEASTLVERTGASLRFMADGTCRRTRQPASSTPITAPANAAAGLLTSGSDGMQKIVWRSAASLYAEAQRYQAFWRQTLANGPVVFVAPVCHAFGFGGLCGALLCDRDTQLIDPAHLGAAEKALYRGGTVFLTPTLARLLSMRPRSSADHEAPHRTAELLAIVGAGPVDKALNDAFKAQFGVGVARNYGSTETGAVLASPPQARDDATGYPMKNVNVRINSHDAHESSRGVTGSFFVQLPEAADTNDGGWVAMGDVAHMHADGAIAILGRQTAAVRRGERFISYAETEAAVADLDGVQAARARPSSTSGANSSVIDSFSLDIWPFDPSDDLPRFANRFLRTAIAPESRPDAIIQRSGLTRSATGKVRKTAPYRSAPPNRLEAAARAYKQSIAVFALYDLGILEALDGRDTADIATSLNLDPFMVDTLLANAQALGIVNAFETDHGTDHETSSTQPISPPPETMDVLRLEQFLYRTINTIENLAQAVRRGRSADPQDCASFLSFYEPVTAGRRARLRASFVMRALDDLGIAPTSMSETGYSRPVYLDNAPESWTRNGRRFTAIVDKDATGEAIETIEFADSVIDLAVFVNAVHWPGSRARLDDAWRRLAVGGVLIIDDVFFNQRSEAASLCIDWITHGGLAFQRKEDLHEYLCRLGADANCLDNDLPPSMRASGGMVLIGRKNA